MRDFSPPTLSEALSEGNLSEIEEFEIIRGGVGNLVIPVKRCKLGLM